MGYTNFVFSSEGVWRVIRVEPEIIGSIKKEGTILYFKPVTFISYISKSESFYKIKKLINQAYKLIGEKVHGISHGEKSIVIETEVLYPKPDFTEIGKLNILVTPYLKPHLGIYMEDLIKKIEIYQAPLYLADVELLSYNNWRDHGFVVTKVILSHDLREESQIIMEGLDFLLR